jgi:hypothetical protein
MAVQDLERIEQKIDRTVAGAVAVSDNVGGIMPSRTWRRSGVRQADGRGRCRGAEASARQSRRLPVHRDPSPGMAHVALQRGQQVLFRERPAGLRVPAYPWRGRSPRAAEAAPALRYEAKATSCVCIVIGHFKAKSRSGRSIVRRKSARSRRRTRPSGSPIRTSSFGIIPSAPSPARYCPDVLLGIYAEDELQRRRAARQRPLWTSPRSPASPHA